MGNSRHRKNHKKKAQARKNRIEQEKNRMKKMQREFIMNLIKKEEEKGMFKDNPSVPPVGPVVDGPIVEGPVI